MEARTTLFQVSLTLVVAISAADPESRRLVDGPDMDPLTDSGAHASETQTMMTAAQEGPTLQGGGPGRFFQDFYSLQYGPRQVEFGHVCENPNEWEQRFERKDLDKSHHQGQVRWGDRNGGYGEHYWDFNHHGGPDDHGHGGHGSAPVPDFVAQDTDEGGVPTYKRMQATGGDPRGDQSGASSLAMGSSIARERDGMSSSATMASVSSTEPAGSRRAYRKKYTSRPAPTSTLPSNTVPWPRTTPRPPPRPSTPLPSSSAATAAASKSSKALVFSSDFPSSGSMFQKEVAAAAGLGPRMPRETLGTAMGSAPRPPKKGVKGQHGPAGVVRKLAFDPRSGRVHDEDTGQMFMLQPVS